MADNAPVPEGAPKPSPSPDTQDKIVLSGKLLVKLSSVAKPPPTGDPKDSSPASPPPLALKQPPPLVLQQARPPALPPKLATPEKPRIINLAPIAPHSTGGILPEVTVKTNAKIAMNTGPMARSLHPITPITMPAVPKKDAPPISTIPTGVTPAPVSKATPPPLPVKLPEPAKSEPGKTEAKSNLIKIATPPLNPTASEDSIFPSSGKASALIEKPSENKKSPEEGKAQPPQQRASEDAKSAPAIPAKTARESVRPPPLPLGKPAEKSVPPSEKRTSLLIEKPQVPLKEKPQVPAVPVEAQKKEAPPIPGAPVKVTKAPPPIAKESSPVKEPTKAPVNPPPLVSKKSEPKLVAKSEKASLFSFLSSKSKSPPSVPASPASTAVGPSGSTIKVEKTEPAPKTPIPPTQIPGAPAKPLVVSESAKSSATSFPAVPPPVASSTAKPATPALPSTPDTGSSAKTIPPNILTPSPASSPAAKVPAVTASAPVLEKASSDKPPIPGMPTKSSGASTAAKADAPTSAPLLAPKKLEKTFQAAPAPATATETRATRARKKRRMEAITFYAIFVVAIISLYFGGLYFSRETRLEGQVIPPPGMTLGNEAWIVLDFRGLAAGVADDLASDRTPALRDIQETQVHVQRAQADVATREERIRLLKEQIQAAKDEVTSTIKQSRDAAQQIWDGPGKQLEDEYQSRLDQFQKVIADRAKSLKLKYEPDDTYHSPEVWANAYRLALYGVGSGVDSTKEHQWLEDQVKQWRDFTQSVDERQKQLREQAAQIQLSPTPKVSELNTQIEELQHRVDSTQAEEDPLKIELQQAQADLAKAQTTEAGLDDVRYKQLYSLPEPNIIRRLPLVANGRFSWRHMEKDFPFAEGEQTHHYWIFSRAARPDGRQYWALHHFDIRKNATLEMIVEPTSFISTKAILRPDLSPDEQQQ